MYQDVPPALRMCQDVPPAYTMQYYLVKWSNLLVGCRGLIVLGTTLVLLLSRRAALSGVLARGVAENSITLTCKKVFIRHLFFLVNLVHLVAIGLIEAGDRLTVGFFRGVRHLLKR